MSATNTVRIMTVYTGNICRSPIAEAVLRQRFEAAGIEGVEIDSTAITSGEAGSPIDRRAGDVLRANDYDPLPNHVARRVEPAQLLERDLVLAMTVEHADYLRRAAAEIGAKPEIRMFRSFENVDGVDGRVTDRDAWDIADPWYGGPEDFDVALAEIEAAADRIVEYVRATRPAHSFPGVSGV